MNFIQDNLAENKRNEESKSDAIMSKNQVLESPVLGVSLEPIITPNLQSSSSADNTMTPTTAEIKPILGSAAMKSEGSRFVVALCEGRRHARGIVGIAAMDINKPALLLCQFSDTPAYTNTLRQINILRPVEVLIPFNVVGSVYCRFETLLKDQFPNVHIYLVARSAFKSNRGLRFVENLCAPEFKSVTLVVQEKFYALASACALIRYVQIDQDIINQTSSLRIEYQESEDTAVIDVDSVTVKHVDPQSKYVIEYEDSDGPIGDKSFDCDSDSSRYSPRLDMYPGKDTSVFEPHISDSDDPKHKVDTLFLQSLLSRKSKTNFLTSPSFEPQVLSSKPSEPINLDTNSEHEDVETLFLQSLLSRKSKTNFLTSPSFEPQVLSSKPSEPINLDTNSEHEDVETLFLQSLLSRKSETNFLTSPSFEPQVLSSKPSEPINLDTSSEHEDVESLFLQSLLSRISETNFLTSPSFEPQVLSSKPSEPINLDTSSEHEDVESLFLQSLLSRISETNFLTSPSFEPQVLSSKPSEPINLDTSSEHEDVESLFLQSLLSRISETNFLTSPSFEPQVLSSKPSEPINLDTSSEHEDVESLFLQSLLSRISETNSLTSPSFEPQVLSSKPSEPINLDTSSEHEDVESLFLQSLLSRISETNFLTSPSFEPQVLSSKPSEPINLDTNSEHEDVETLFLQSLLSRKSKTNSLTSPSFEPQVLSSKPSEPINLDTNLFVPDVPSSNIFETQSPDSVLFESKFPYSLPFDISSSASEHFQSESSDLLTYLSKQPKLVSPVPENDFLFTSLPSSKPNDNMGSGSLQYIEEATKYKSEIRYESTDSYGSERRESITVSTYYSVSNYCVTDYGSLEPTGRQETHQTSYQEYPSHDLGSWSTETHQSTAHSTPWSTNSTAQDRDRYQSYHVNPSTSGYQSNVQLSNIEDMACPSTSGIRPQRMPKSQSTTCQDGSKSRVPRQKHTYQTNVCPTQQTSRTSRQHTNISTDDITYAPPNPDFIIENPVKPILKRKIFPPFSSDKPKEKRCEINLDPRILKKPVKNLETLSCMSKSQTTSTTPTMQVPSEGMLSAVMKPKKKLKTKSQRDKGMKNKRTLEKYKEPEKTRTERVSSPLFKHEKKTAKQQLTVPEAYVPPRRETKNKPELPTLNQQEQNRKRKPKTKKKPNVKLEKKPKISYTGNTPNK